MLQGYKTYITAAIGIVTQIGLYLSGDESLAMAITGVIGFAAVFFTRAGITNSVNAALGTNVTAANTASKIG